MPSPVFFQKSQVFTFENHLDESEQFPVEFFASILAANFPELCEKQNCGRKDSGEKINLPVVVGDARPRRVEAAATVIAHTHTSPEKDPVLKIRVIFVRSKIPAAVGKARGRSRWKMFLKKPLERASKRVQAENSHPRISARVYAGEGSFMFGDHAHGYAIAFVFSLRDSMARGKKRTFSLVYLSSDRVFLVQSMAFVSGCMAGIVKYLQVRAATNTGFTAF